MGKALVELPAPFSESQVAEFASVHKELSYRPSRSPQGTASVSLIYRLDSVLPMSHDRTAYRIDLTRHSQWEIPFSTQLKSGEGPVLVDMDLSTRLLVFPFGEIKPSPRVQTHNDARCYGSRGNPQAAVLLHLSPAESYFSGKNAGNDFVDAMYAMDSRSVSLVWLIGKSPDTVLTDYNWHKHDNDISTRIRQVPPEVAARTFDKRNYQFFEVPKTTQKQA